MSGISLASGFDRTSAQPLDLYSKVADITARNAISAGVRYQGMAVYVLSTATNYQLQGGILDANWVAVGGTVAHTATDSITAHAGGGQGSAVALTTEFNRITVCATSGDSVKLPAATVGLEVIVLNAGATTAAVFPSTGEAIDAGAVDASVNLNAGSSAIYLCLTAGTWRSLALGSATPVPVTKTSNYTITITDKILLVDATSGAITITLPAASTAIGLDFLIKKIDSSANAVTIARAGADTIDGATSETMPFQYTTRRVVGQTSSTWGIY